TGLCVLLSIGTSPTFTNPGLSLFCATRCCPSSSRVSCALSPYRRLAAMANRKYPRAPEWQKRDLHLHAPGTKLSNQFEATGGGNVWDEYCRRLHDSDVQAFGITDYFSADCYFGARDEYRERYPDSSKVFFPNIELRT